jgi:hypothetical protein
MVFEKTGKNSSIEATRIADTSLDHLQAELARLDILIQRAVRCWQLAGQNLTDAFRGLYVSDAEADQLLQRPLASSWGETISLPEAEEQIYLQAGQQAELQARAIQNAANKQKKITRLQSLVQAFELDDFEKDVLLLCLAPAVDLRYEKVYGYLQDDVTRKRPGINLVLNLLCPAGHDRLLALSHFAVDAPLFRYHLLEQFSEPGQNKAPLLSQSLLLDPTVAHWLLGTYHPGGDVAPYFKLLWPTSGEQESIGLFDDMEPAEFLDEHPICIFSGPDRLAQQIAAQALASRLDQSLLILELADLPKEEISPAQAVRIGLRDARLIMALLFVQGWDELLAEGSSAGSLFAEMARHPATIILAGQAAWRPSGLPSTRALRWQEFPIPDYASRKSMWEAYLQQANCFLPLELSSLAGQFNLTREQIRDAVWLAVNHAGQRADRLTEEDLTAAARSVSSSQLSGLAHKIPARYRWEDIVLPPDQITLLQEIVATVRGRPRVLEEWGVGQKLASSRGVSMLFAGPPGTGKTMSAQIIAAELGLDLYKIDLSTIVSKYIGETEKNLERIFTEAESSNAILFFDEADALFGKRSEVRDSHDRYANVEISYLLQRMEAYDGVTILATNLRANLDEAFTRRLQFVVDFPFPEEEDRLRIWRGLFPPQVPRADLDLAFMARRYKLAGGNIRNIILTAAYLASANGGLVTMVHLLHGTRRELQKMGRLVNEKDMTLEEGENVR